MKKYIIDDFKKKAAQLFVFNFILPFAITSSAQAQSRNFTQINTNPINLNPAFSGLIEKDFRLNILHRNWYENSYQSMSTATIINCDMRIRVGKYKTDAIGFGILADQRLGADGISYKRNFGIAAAYHHHFKSKWSKKNTISLGINGNLNDWHLNIVDWNYDPTPFIADSFIRQSTFDAALGLIWSCQISDKSSFKIGTSYFNFLRPEDGVLLVNDQPQINVEFNANGSFGHKINSKSSYQAHVFFQKSGPESFLTIGNNISYQINKAKSKYKAINVGVFYRLQDAIAPYFALEIGKSKIGLNIDYRPLTFQPANKSPIQAYEITYVYQGALKKVSRKAINSQNSRF